MFKFKKSYLFENFQDICSVSEKSTYNDLDNDLLLNSKIKQSLIKLKTKIIKKRKNQNLLDIWLKKFLKSIKYLNSFKRYKTYSRFDNL